MTIEKHTEFCRNMVRNDDRDRYDCSLFAPVASQPVLWALYAFNQEVAKTRENVSEAALGQIRLQWWRDVLDELRAGQVREHPVVQAMSVHLTCPKVLATLDDLIDARENDLYDEGPADFPALVQYAETVGGTLSEAALIACCERVPDQSLVSRVRTVGRAWAMMGLVRAVPFHWASNRNYLPGDNGKASLATTDADKMYELAAPSIDQMLAYTVDQVETLKQQPEKLADEVRHLVLPTALIEMHLKNLSKVGNNPFRANEVSSFSQLWCLVKATFQKRYG